MKFKVKALSLNFFEKLLTIENFWNVSHLDDNGDVKGSSRACNNRFTSEHFSYSRLSMIVSCECGTWKSSHTEASHDFFRFLIKSSNDLAQWFIKSSKQPSTTMCRLCVKIPSRSGHATASSGQLMLPRVILYQLQLVNTQIGVASLYVSGHYQFGGIFGCDVRNIVQVRVTWRK